MKFINHARVGLSVPFALMLTAAPALAQTAAPAINKGDTTWMMTATVLVLVMTVPGLSLFYGGLVRSTATASSSPVDPISSAASRKRFWPVSHRIPRAVPLLSASRFPKWSSRCSR